MITNIIAPCIFDVLMVFGTLVTISCGLKLTKSSVRRAVTYGGIASRDTDELIPEAKVAWTGIVLMVLTLIGKQILVVNSEYHWIHISDSILFAVILVSIIVLTLMLRLLVINRYWKGYDGDSSEEP